MGGAREAWIRWGRGVVGDLQMTDGIRKFTRSTASKFCAASTYLQGVGEGSSGGGEGEGGGGGVERRRRTGAKRAHMFCR